jgi:phosphoribosyl-AMP cyclohydrolase
VSSSVSEFVGYQIHGKSGYSRWVSHSFRELAVSLPEFAVSAVPANGRRLRGAGSVRWDGSSAARRRTGQLATVPVPDVFAADASATAQPPAARGPARPSALDPAIAARLRRTPDGLVAAVVRQHDTGEVLMLAWMDDEALHRTLTTGRATYWSRSRREYWVKGATSGHHQYVRSVALDCDGDAVLLSVDQVGAACHTGSRTCFFDQLPVTGTRTGDDAEETR